MPIIIENHTARGVSNDEPHRYHLRVNDRLLCTFEHVRSNGLAECLRRAADAWEKASEMPQKVSAPPIGLIDTSCAIPPRPVAQGPKGEKVTLAKLCKAADINLSAYILPEEMEYEPEICLIDGEEDLLIYDQDTPRMAVAVAQIQNPYNLAVEALARLSKGFGDYYASKIVNGHNKMLRAEAVTAEQTG